MNFNTQYIFPGDDKDQILEKTNYNFSQIFFNGVGLQGPLGNIGATGIIGQSGRDGQIGLTGDRATNWYFSADEPTEANSQENDIWINVGTTGSQDVFIYNGSAWIFSGESLLTASAFGLLTEISGPGGITTHNAVEIANPTPSNVTFVLSDAEGTTSDINTNLAKVLIATDASSNNFPSLGFDKTFVGSLTIPSFQWKEIGPSYNLDYASPGDLTFISGLTSSYGSTGGNTILSAQTSVSVVANTSISFVNATGASAAMAFITPGSLVISGQNVEIDPSAAIFKNLTDESGLTASTTTLATVSNTGNGVLVEITGASATGPMIASFKNSAGFKVFESRGNNFNVIGESGPSGSASGSLVKGIQGLTPSASSTFVSNYFTPSSTNNVVPVPLSSTSFDIITLTPLYGGTPTADGKPNRVYLQISGFSGIFNNFTNEGRIFDVFMDDPTLCFAGIRSVFPGGSSIAPIGDVSNSATGGCRHIRLQTITSSVIYFNAFSPSGLFPRTGYIEIAGSNNPQLPSLQSPSL